MRPTINQLRCRRGAGFTLIELLVVVAILALLISMLVPSLAAAKERSRITLCVNKLNHMGDALGQYVTANHDLMPPYVFMDSVSYAWNKTRISGQSDPTYQSFYIYRNLIGTYMGLGDCMPQRPNSPPGQYERWERAMYTHFKEYECPSGVNMASPYGWAVSSTNPTPPGQGEGNCYYAQNVSWNSQKDRIQNGHWWPGQSAYFPLFTDTSSAILLYEQWSGNGGAGGGADSLGQPYSTHYKYGKKGVEGIGRSILYADWHVKFLDSGSGAEDRPFRLWGQYDYVQRGNEMSSMFQDQWWNTTWTFWDIYLPLREKG